MDLNMITGVAELVVKYGFPVLCAVIVLIFYIVDRKRDKEIIDKLANRAIEYTHPDSKDSNDRDEIDREIHLLLEGLLRHTHASRSYIYLYHNGIVSTSGFSFQKMSCISEAVVSGIAPVASDSQGIQRSPFSELIYSLKEKGEYFVSDIQSLEEKSPYIYEWCSRRHSNACYIKSVKDHQGYIIGFVGIDYASVSERDIEEEKIRTKLNEASVATSSLVLVGTFREKTKKEKEKTE